MARTEVSFSPHLMPLEKYQPKFRITKKMEKQCWERIVETNGFRKAT
jgi:hypothetical protein